MLKMRMLYAYQNSMAKPEMPYWQVVAFGLTKFISLVRPLCQTRFLILSSFPSLAIWFILHLDSSVSLAT